MLKKTGDIEKIHKRDKTVHFYFGTFTFKNNLYYS